MSINCCPLSVNITEVPTKYSICSGGSGIILDFNSNDPSFLYRINCTTPGLYIDKYANVGINYSAPFAQLDVNSNNGACLILRYNNTENKTSFYVSDNGNLNVSSSGNYVNVLNNVNITTTGSTPFISALNSSLVLGNVCSFTLGRSASINEQAQWSFHYDTTSYQSLSFYNNPNILTITNNNRIGINTNTPSCTLQVSGSVSLQTPSIYAIYLGDKKGAFDYYTTPSSFNTSIIASDAISASTFICTSDRRTKQDIEILNCAEAIDFVSNIRPVKFRFKNNNKSAFKEYGFIAQELYQYPSLLGFTKKEGLPKEDKYDIKNVLISVDYGKIVPLHHSVLQNLLKRLQRLEELLLDTS